MPQIPLITPIADVPRGTGLPRGGQRAPSVPSPDAPQGLGSILGGALRQAGSDVLQATELGVRTQEVGARVQRAQAMLSAKQKLSDYVIQLDQEYSTLEQADDYATLSTRTVERGKALMQEYTQGLSPEAAALFQQEAGQRLAVVHQRALASTTQRRDAETVYVRSQAKDQARLDLENARTVAEQSEAIVRYERLNMDLVRAGLMHGDVASKEVTAFRQTATEVLATRWTTAFPEQAVEHYGALLRGEAGTAPNAPEVPRGQEEKYFNLAQQEYTQQLNLKEHGRQVAERDLAKAQERTEVELTNEVWNAGSVGQLQALKRTVGRVSADTGPDGVSDVGQRRLYAQIDARVNDMRAAVRAPKSDPTVLLGATTAVYGQRGTRPLETTQLLLDQTIQAMQSGKLTVEDGKPLMIALQDELREDSPLRLPDVAKQRQELHTELQTTSPFEKFDETAEARRNVAMREYDDRMQHIAGTEGAVAAGRQAEGVRREIANTMATTTMRSVFEQLSVPPRELPPGIVDETHMAPDAATIESRFTAGKAEIIRRWQKGLMREDEAASALFTLGARRRQWEYILQQQPPPQASTQQGPGWWQRWWNHLFPGSGSPPGAGQPTPAPGPEAETAPAGGFVRR